MVFQGNFAFISLPGLLQLLCQERRSVTLTAWRGHSQAEVQIYEGLIVAARCGALSGAEAVHQLAVWESGQFQLAALDEPPDEVLLAAGWEELMLEAARKRDELELSLRPLPPYPERNAVDRLLRACPALAGVALVGRDGRLLASVGLDDALLAAATALASSIAVAAQTLDAHGGSPHAAQPVAKLRVGERTLLLAARGSTLFLATPTANAEPGEAERQLASTVLGE